MTTGCCGETDFEKLATFEELDETGRVLSEKNDEIRERGEFGPEGGTLSDADVEDALANL